MQLLYGNIKYISEYDKPAQIISSDIIFTALFWPFIIVPPCINNTMTTVGEDKQYRTVPENGHVLLLMETRPGQRTFSDYPNLVTCLDTLTELYEQSLALSGFDEENYILEKLWEWINEFHRLEVFIYDKEISRYKCTKRDELKQLFIDQIKKLGKPKGSFSVENGTGNDNDDDIADWDE